MSNVRTRAAQTPCRLRAPQNAFRRQNGAKTNAVRVTMPSRRAAQTPCRAAAPHKRPTEPPPRRRFRLFFARCYAIMAKKEIAMYKHHEDSIQNLINYYKDTDGVIAVVLDG